MKQQTEQFMGCDIGLLEPTRAAALKHFLTQGFPTRREENWKYTDLSFLKNEAFAYSENLNVSDIELKGFQSTDVYKLTFINGYYAPHFSSIDELTAHCHISSLNEALKTQSTWTKNHLENISSKDARFLDLNNALMTDGFVINVSKNTIMPKPLHILFIATKAEQTPFMSFARNLIELAPNSQLTLFEEHIDLSDTRSMKNHITQITMGENASLDMYKLQNQNDEAIHIAQTLVQQARNSQFKSLVVTLGGKLSRDDLNILLNDEGASCTLNGLYLGDHHQHVDHHTRIDHFKSHGSSQEYYKGILSGQARGVFNGKVIVHPGAQKTVSQQINKNLLLSKQAEVDTKPELEIYADDVACAHGATIGQIDPESLFYLRSRGLDKKAAFMLLMEAFADEILTTAQPHAVIHYMREWVHKKMSHLSKVQENNV